MKKPVIGVMPLFDDEKNSVWMIPGYLEGLEASGAVPVILSPKLDEDGFSALCDNIDGYLFTGGHDVSPALYGEEALPECGKSCGDRDRLEKMIFDFCVKNDIPLLGICRGIQIINVLCGGTLYQDINSQYKNDKRVEHHMSAPYDRVQHRVDIIPNSALGELLNKTELGVNSYHHQAIKDLGQGLEPMAVSEDGLIEALRMQDKKFIWGLQWHPELSYRTDSDEKKIFDAFVSFCCE